VAVASAEPYTNLHLDPDTYHTSIPSVFYRPDGRCPSCHPTNSVKALKEGQLKKK